MAYLLQNVSMLLKYALIIIIVIMLLDRGGIELIMMRCDWAKKYYIIENEIIKKYKRTYKNYNVMKRYIGNTTYYYYR